MKRIECVISHLHRWHNSEVFVDVYKWLSLDKSNGEFSIVYKKWVLCYCLGSITTISACNYSSTPRGLFRYSRCASHHLFHALVLWHAYQPNQLRNGMKCTCAHELTACVPLTTSRRIDKLWAEAFWQIPRRIRTWKMPGRGGGGWTCLPLTELSTCR